MANESFFGDMSNELVNIHQQARTREVEVDSGGKLPGNIENGIAELRDIKIDRYEDGDFKGKPYFYANAVVIEPDYVIDPDTKQKMRVKGMFTHFKREPLCNTPDAQGKRKTIGDHWIYMENALKLLGLKDYLEKFEGKSNKEIENHVLEGIKILKTMKPRPRFHFRTWKGAGTEIIKRHGQYYVVQGKKQIGGPFSSEKAAKEKFPYAGQESLVNHVWQGLVDFTAENTKQIVNEDEDTQDDTGATSAPVATDKPEPIAEKAPERDYSQLDVPALVEAATAGDNTARDVLEEYAAYVGIPKQEIDDVKTWQGLADMIADAIKGSSPSGQPPVKPVAPPPTASTNGKQPRIGEVYNYQVLQPNGQPEKDRRGGDRPPILAEVTFVDVPKQTVTVVNKLDRKTSYCEVPWKLLLSSATTEMENAKLVTH